MSLLVAAADAQKKDKIWRGHVSVRSSNSLEYRLLLELSSIRLFPPVPPAQRFQATQLFRAVQRPLPLIRQKSAVQFMSDALSIHRAGAKTTA
jgi:hypothetical protein